MEPYWPGTNWYRLIDFPLEQADGKRLYLDERAAWFYEAVTTSLAMVTRTPGFGQVYLSAKRDKDSNALRGGETYRLTISPNPPGKQFWAVTVYSGWPRFWRANRNIPYGAL